MCVNNNLICLAADKRYSKYAYVTIYSIIKNHQSDEPLKFCILSSGMDDELSSMFHAFNTNNIELTIIDMDAHIKKYQIDKLFTARHLTTAAYFRLAIPEIFPEYSSVLYLDCDIIVLGDIIELLNFDLGDKALGVLYDADRHRVDIDREQWINKYLGIPVHDYFCSGVMLYNIEKCREFRLTDKAFAYCPRVPDPPYLDQDILNAVAHSITAQIPPEWHIMAYSVGKRRLQEVLKKRRELLKEHYLYMRAAQRPKLIHYCGSVKPWGRPFIQFGEIWWKYAEETPLVPTYFRRKRYSAKELT